jgi:hypothetical protein
MCAGHPLSEPDVRDRLDLIPVASHVGDDDSDIQWQLFRDIGGIYLCL